jgi:hypothetical protein
MNDVGVLDEEVLFPIAQAIDKSRKITSLDISSNNIHDIGMQSFVKQFGNHPTIIRLDLSLNLASPDRYNTKIRHTTSQNFGWLININAHLQTLYLIEITLSSTITRKYIAW